MLRQRSRSYLFSNLLSPAICGASIAVFDMLSKSTELRDRVMDNANYFKKAKLNRGGFDLKPSESAICALMLYDAVLFSTIRRRITERKHLRYRILLPGCTERTSPYSYPLSAAHTLEQLIAHWLPSSRSVNNWALSNKKITPTSYKTVWEQSQTVFLFLPSPFFSMPNTCIYLKLLITIR